ncbi:leucine-rich repeat extensin-like protein 5 [Ischnura elegans]|uniref:leucine-rich repeat extensin-like protein 5 n=1 Tax=Ischnura elegans TaxID=197161 RepID=UPI001ED8AD53|nr:leucine-rich repeat extensin-like protein 5 [Ischnura elegans]
MGGGRDGLENWRVAGKISLDIDSGGDGRTISSVAQCKAPCVRGERAVGGRAPKERDDGGVRCGARTTPGGRESPKPRGRRRSEQCLIKVPAIPPPSSPDLYTEPPPSGREKKNRIRRGGWSTRENGADKEGCWERAFIHPFFPAPNPSSAASLPVGGHPTTPGIAASLIRGPDASTTLRRRADSPAGDPSPNPSPASSPSPDTVTSTPAPTPAEARRNHPGDVCHVTTVAPSPEAHSTPSRPLFALLPSLPASYPHRRPTFLLFLCPRVYNVIVILL